jgi:hypothetical protein
MFSTAREKTLALFFGGSLAVFGLWETVGQMVLQPLTEARNAVDAARAANSVLSDQSATVEHALRNLKPLESQSLPSDPGKASVLYQGWLIRHLEQNSISSAIVTPAPPIVEKTIGHRIPFTVQCEASTRNIAKFLDQFYATPLMHRITNLNIANSSEGEADHRVTISIEAIAFGSATRIESLPEPAAITDDSSLLAVLSKGDIFRRQLPVQTYVEPTPVVAESSPEPEVQAELPAKADPQKSVRFVASVWNGQQREAWLVDGRSSEEISVVALSELKLPDISGRIISIDDDVLHLELHGQRRSLSLGKTLSESTVAK